MAAPILTSQAVVMCGHAGPASHIPSQTRVLIGGSPVAVAADQHPVSGCSLASGSATFCTVLTWTMPAVRVMAGGQPVLLQSSLPIGVGPGTVVSAQPRVTGQ